MFNSDELSRLGTHLMTLVGVYIDNARELRKIDPDKPEQAHLRAMWTKDAAQQMAARYDNQLREVRVLLDRVGSYGDGDRVVLITREQRCTVLAALALWIKLNQCDPEYRADDIDEIATDYQNVGNLDSEECAELCQLFDSAEPAPRPVDEVKE